MSDGGFAMNEPVVQSATLHVTPVGDLIEHEIKGDGCPCGPTTAPRKCIDGSMGWLILHHSLDGRERNEP